MNLVITPKSEKDLLNQPPTKDTTEKIMPVVNEDNPMKLKDKDSISMNTPLLVETPTQEPKAPPVKFAPTKKPLKVTPPKKQLFNKERPSRFNTKEKKIEKKVVEKIENEAKIDINKTRFIPEDSPPVVEKKDINVNNTNKEAELLRTNIYYTKKLYEEVSDLRKTIKRQGYIKYTINFIILAITLMSFYYGVQAMKTIFTDGGISSLIPAISSSQGINPSSLQGNLFGQAMKILDTKGITNTSSNKESINTLLQSEAVNVESIVNEFLK